MVSEIGDGNNLTKQIAEWDKKFQKVKTAVEKADKDAKTAEGSLYFALQQALVFTQSFLSDTDNLKAFVENHGQKWGMTAQRNMFIPIVNIAFVNASASQKSKYATVLKHANKRSVGNNFAQWVTEEGFNLDKRYEEAISLVAGEDVKNARKEESYNIGNKIIDNVRISDPIKIKIPVGVQAGYTLVLARVVSDDEVELVKIVDSDANSMKRVIGGFSDSGVVARNILARQPLFEFFRAIEFVSRLSSVSGAKNKRHIIILPGKDADGDVLKVFSVSNKNTFVYAEALVRNSTIKIDGGKSVIFDMNDISDFISIYDCYGDWAAQITDGGLKISCDSGKICFWLIP